MDDIRKVISSFFITDNILFRELLTIWANDHCDDIRIVGSCSTGKQAVSLIERLVPDVILLNCDDLNDYDVALPLLERWPKLKIIVLTHNNDPMMVVKAANIGIAACLNRTANIMSLTDAIRTVHFEGKILRPYEETLTISKATHHESTDTFEQNMRNLSNRENEILDHVAQGKTNRAIAALLDISEHTVRNHISNIFHKLGVKNRTEAAIRLTNKVDA